MLENIRVLSSWHHKYYKVIQTLWKRRVVKQDESNGDPEFIVTIGLEGKLIIYWNIDKRQSWKWIKICKAFKPHIGI